MTALEIALRNMRQVLDNIEKIEQDDGWLDEYSWISNRLDINYGYLDTIIKCKLADAETNYKYELDLIDAERKEDARKSDRLTY